MRKRQHLKANLDRRDANRALVTETSPYEVPIIFSNDGFYKNIKLIDSASSNLKLIVEGVVLKPQNYTIPYRYRISKSSGSLRRLSLLHPSAQIEVSRFYQKYENLICYYCGQSDFSIRFPDKVGSSYFFTSSISERNAYKRNSVDTVSLDTAVRNPSSYFAYREYDRLYKFFQSGDFVRLEKKFRVMSFLDISNCFGSIYTHTISWALKSMRHAKENLLSSSFGNDFDKLMQRMNFNETNGICIGPEVSRIFAEIILQDIDRRVISRALSAGLQNKTHFECRRYVDDYILFSQSEEIADKIIQMLGAELEDYKLHLNKQKQERYLRPFQTNKSQTIEDINEKLSTILDTMVEWRAESPRVAVPKHIYRPSSAVKAFIAGIKACCFDRGVGYEMVSNYVIGALLRSIEDLIDGFSSVDKEQRVDDERYVQAFDIFLEMIYFLYTVCPTVGTSYRVAKATIISCDFFKANFPDRLTHLSERLTTWMVQVVQSVRPEEIRGGANAIPVEIINIVLAMSHLSKSQLVEPSYLESLFDIEYADYFSIVSALYYIKDNSKFKDTKAKLKLRIKALINPNADLLKNAHNVHLALDLVCCPYLPIEDRRDVLDTLRIACSLPTWATNEKDELIREMEARPWFVQWNKIELLSMIRKKELSAVY